MFDNYHPHLYRVCCETEGPKCQSAEESKAKQQHFHQEKFVFSEKREKIIENDCGKDIVTMKEWTRMLDSVLRSVSNMLGMAKMSKKDKKQNKKGISLVQDVGQNVSVRPITQPPPS